MDALRGEGRAERWLLEPCCLSHIHWTALLGVKRSPDYRQAFRILAFLPLLFSYPIHLSHSPRHDRDYSTMAVNYRHRVYFRKAVDLSKQTFSKFWRPFFLGWRSLVGWGLALPFHILPLAVKMQLRPRRSFTVTTVSECSVSIGSKITSCGSYKFKLQKKPVNHHITKSSPGLTAEVRSGEGGSIGEEFTLSSWSCGGNLASPHWS